MVRSIEFTKDIIISGKEIYDMVRIINFTKDIYIKIYDMVRIINFTKDIPSRFMIW